MSKNNVKNDEKFNRLGFDADGFDRDGFDREGFDRDGFDRLGFDADGFNREGFTADRIHRETGTELNPDGYNFYGVLANGYPNRLTVNRPSLRDADGFDKRGYNVYGYDRDGVRGEWGDHDLTGESYDAWGVDCEGYNESGWLEFPDRNDDASHILTNNITKTFYDEDGYDRHGFDVNGFTRDGEQYGADGYDKWGFNRDGWVVSSDPILNAFHGVRAMNKHTRTAYDLGGFNIHGFNKDGYNRAGYDADGYNRAGYNADGYNRAGRDIDGFYTNGFNIHGFNRDGFNRDGFNKDSLHRDTGTHYSPDGFDENGYSVIGERRNGDDYFGYKNLNRYTDFLKDFPYINQEKIRGKRTRSPYRNLVREGWVREHTQGWNVKQRTYIMRESFTHKKTGTHFNPDGFDVTGVNADGITETGFDTATGLHTETGKLWNSDGFNIEGELVLLTMENLFG